MKTYFKVELIYKIPQYRLNVIEINADLFCRQFNNFELNKIIQESEEKTFILLEIEEAEKLEVDLTKAISTILILRDSQKIAKTRNQIIGDAMQRLIDDRIVLLNMKMARLNRLRSDIAKQYMNN